MFSRVFLFAIVSVAIGCLGSSARAEDKKKELATIVSVSTMQMTTTRGHDVNVTCQVPKDSIVCYNGLPAKVSDLRAGMIVSVRPDATGKIALAIRAHNPAHH